MQPIPRIILVTLSGLGLLAGCTSGPAARQPDNPLPAADWQARSPVALTPASPPARWWTLFNDPLLDTLQQQALGGNLDLQLAASRIEQSRARLGIAAGEALPALGLSASEAREALSEHGKFAALGAPTAPSRFYQLGLDASWELDLWGRARRVEESAAAQLQASVQDRAAAGVSLSAEVARTYLQLRGVQAQLQIARQNQDSAARTLELSESRQRNGVATQFETASARAQLASSSAALPPLLQQRNLLLNALALLLGAAPRSLDTWLSPAMPLPQLPTRVPVGIPSELARHRPDILRAEAQLQAATASIGVAQADFYPRISLRGRLGVEAFSSGDLASWDSRLFSVGPTLYLPIFQGGQLVQRLALSEAQQKTAALQYRQTVLQAWHEVDNALDAWASWQQRHAELQQACAQNQLALQAAERGYQQGAADYLSVLTAQRSLLASQTSLNDSATAASLALVGLYRALGGGWPDLAAEQP